MTARLRRRSFLAGAVVATVSRAVAAAPVPTFGLRLHHAEGAGGHRPLHHATRSLELARTIYRPLGFDLVIAETANLDATMNRIESLAMRDALSRFVAPGVIDVFLVEALRDSVARDVWRMGVTWDSRTNPVRRYVILTNDAMESSLAHELGHYFGVPEHSATKNNLMSYDREDALVLLDDGQKARIRAGAERLAKSGTLRTVAADGAASS